MTKLIFLTDLSKAFANHRSTDIKLSKTQLSKKIQLGGFLGRLLGPLLKTGFPLMKSVIQPLAKCVLIPLGLTAAASAADAGIHKEILRSGLNTTLIISNDEMEDKSLEYSGILLKRISETIKDEAKEQKGEFFSMLLRTLGASLLGNVLAGQGVIGARGGTAKVGYECERSSLKDNLTDKTKDGAHVINLNEYSNIGTHWIALYVNTKTL